MLELGQVYNGPYCGLLLAAQGAEVIKVEPPAGEIVRRHASSPGGASYSFLMLNAGKRGVTLNLKHERGRALFLDLVERADVVVENFRSGALDELRLGWDVLSARNPRLILASGRGFRASSPFARLGAMDFTVQALSGHMEITGFPDHPPVKAGATLCDMLGSVHLFAAILLALRERDRTGRGRPVEVAMLDATFPALMGYAAPYLEHGLDVGRTGNRHSVPGSSPYGIYPTTDGWVAILCLTDEHWRHLVGVLGDRELADDRGLDSGPARAAERERIDARVSAWTRGRSRGEVLEQLAAGGVPAAPVRRLGEALDDPYNVEEGLLRWTEYEGRGPIRVLGSPIQLREPGERGASRDAPEPPPHLGEHNREVYGRLLGLDAEALEDLAREGAI